MGIWSAPNGFCTSRSGNRLSTSTAPCLRTFSRVLPPASATTRRLPSTSTSTALLSTAPPSGLLSRSKSQMSASRTRAVTLDAQHPAEEVGHRVLCGELVAIGVGRAPIRDQDLVLILDEDAVWSDRASVRALVGERGEALDQPALVAVLVDHGDCAGGAHAHRALRTREAWPRTAATGLGDIQRVATEREVPRAVETAGDLLDLRRARGCGGGEDQAGDEWQEILRADMSSSLIEAGPELAPTEAPALRGRADSSPRSPPSVLLS